MNKLIIISGATATGKTGASIKLFNFLKSNHISAEIVNFDSLCFYKELSVGTAKPSKEELASAPHHLVGHQSIRHPLNASQFVEEADLILDSLWKKKSIPILVGGSGFYLRALLKGMFSEPNNQEKCDSQDIPIEDISNFLKENDPDSYDSLHPNDHYRLRRAYEYFQETGEKISQAKKNLKEPYNFLVEPRLTSELQHFYLNVDKDFHWKIIQKRTHQMIQNGLIEEVQGLLDSGYNSELKPLQSIGYKETVQYLSGEIPSLESLEERISISTRQLAKAQRTFFAKVTPKLTIDSTNEDSQAMMLEKSLNFAQGL